MLDPGLAFPVASCSAIFLCCLSPQLDILELVLANDCNYVCGKSILSYVDVSCGGRAESKNLLFISFERLRCDLSREGLPPSNVSHCTPVVSDWYSCVHDFFTYRSHKQRMDCDKKANDVSPPRYVTNKGVFVECLVDRTVGASRCEGLSQHLLMHFRVYST
jgi:hypothetical protein